MQINNERFTNQFFTSFKSIMIVIALAAGLLLFTIQFKYQPQPAQQWLAQEQQLQKYLQQKMNISTGTPQDNNLITNVTDATDVTNEKIIEQKIEQKIQNISMIRKKYEKGILEIIKTMKDAQNYINIDKILILKEKIDQLPFCILIDGSVQQRKMILESLQEQNYQNYHQYQLDGVRQIDLKSNSPNQYFQLYKLLQRTECGESDIIIPLSAPLKANALIQLNKIFQQYHTYLLYSTFQYQESNEGIQVIGFYRRIFELLFINDFDLTNNYFLNQKDYGLIIRGIFELCRRQSKKIKNDNYFEGQAPHSFLSSHYAIKYSYNRTQYQNLWYITQSFPINETQYQKNWQDTLQDKQFRHVARKSRTTLQQMKMAMEYRQLLYFPKNHSLVERQKRYLNNMYNISQYQQELPMCLFVPNHNNLQYNRYERFVRSVVQQDYSNFHIVFLEDFSDDETLLYTVNLFKDLGFDYINRVHFISSLKQNYATYNIVVGVLNYCGRHDIAVGVDGDDQFIGKQAFKFLNAIYQARPEKWIVYTQFYSSDFGYGTSLLIYNQNMIVDRQGKRTAGHYVGHLTSFRAQLMRYIKLQDHKKQDGNWLDTFYDDAFQFPMTQLAGLARIQFIPEIFYYYNRGYGDNDDSTFQKRQYRRRIYYQLKGRKPYKRISKLDYNYSNQEVQAIIQEDKGVKYQQILPNFIIPFRTNLKYQQSISQINSSNYTD